MRPEQRHPSSPDFVGHCPRLARSPRPLAARVLFAWPAPRVLIACPELTA
nr:hypothetical protein RVX_0508 [Nitratidesulfovibrio sp. HK-II]